MQSSKERMFLKSNTNVELSYSVLISLKDGKESWRAMATGCMQLIWNIGNICVFV